MRAPTLVISTLLVSLSLSHVAHAENCSTSFFCYGKTNPQASSHISAKDVHHDESATGVTINRSPACQSSHRTLLSKASKLEALARKKQAEKQPAQAQRLLNNARQLRANASRLNCR